MGKICQMGVSQPGKTPIILSFIAFWPRPGRKRPGYFYKAA
jgi:hypothetical protein